MSVCSTCSAIKRPPGGSPTKRSIPTIPGTPEPITDPAVAAETRATHRFPAHHQSGIRRRRTGHARRRPAGGFRSRLQEARQEAGAAFGNDAVFLERYIRRAKHIEVQILGDKHGNILHLYERDCSVQRRHQKVVEVAPAVNLDHSIRRELADAAVRLAQTAGYYNAGTVEFLVDMDTGEWFFIEVNPRVQVEHTVTEMVTGIDIVRSQILVAQGERAARARDASAAAGRGAAAWLSRCSAA